MSGSSLLTPLLILWAVVTGAFITVVIWKSLVGLREDGSVILDPAEASQAAEQQAVIAKVERLGSWAKRFGFTSLTLLVLVGAIWVYRIILNFNGTQIP
ncbi:MAG TPA: hypothetical protein VMB03_14545 [Bryobacteraceae bacterium]|nr:hypothetical protein [Bryobacteraceae bacterium]